MSNRPDYHLVSPFELERFRYPPQGLLLRVREQTSQDDLEWLLEVEKDAEPAPTLDGRIAVGLSTCTNEAGTGVVGLALATLTRAIFIAFPVEQASTQPSLWPEEDGLPPEDPYTVGPAPARDPPPAIQPFVDMFTSDEVLLVGFKLAQTIVQVKRYLGVDACGVDIATAYRNDAEVEAMVVNKVFGQKKGSVAFQKLWYTSGETQVDGMDGEVHLPLRSWLAVATCLHKSFSHRVEQSREVDVERLQSEQIDFFGAAIAIGNRLEALKPSSSVATFEKLETRFSGQKLLVTNAKFSTRLRTDPRQTVRVSFVDSDEIVEGMAESVSGQVTTVRLQKAMPAGSNKVKQIEVVGREGGTQADARWETYMRQLLEGTVAPYETDLLTRMLWAGSRSQRQRSRLRAAVPTVSNIHSSAERLNTSQRRAHDAIVSPVADDPSGDSKVLLLIGPPGTGKTSVISASVNSWLLNFKDGCIYCATASNIAAKNIAESLLKTGNKDFRLIVSRDFYEGWHEHLYKLDGKMIVTSQLTSTTALPEILNLMRGVRVIITTLSLLSSAALHSNKFFAHHPMKLLLVDEASQIRLDEYPHVIDRFATTLEKMALFGDDNQLPPFQSSQVWEIRSVFETHLRKEALFLNTQYRMPKAVGTFISSHVYGGRLTSGENVSQEPDCVRFVDTGAEGEQIPAGTSLKNDREVDIIVALVRHFYGKTDFRILTPYEAQRQAIEDALKAESLPWEDRVFNIDIFQGHEAGVILISLVRTEGFGFLTDRRRSNVALSRLQKAMVIISKREYIEGAVAHTLFGKLAAHIGPKAWVAKADIFSGVALLPECGSPIQPGEVVPLDPPRPSSAATLHRMKNGFWSRADLDALPGGPFSSPSNTGSDDLPATGMETASLFGYGYEAEEMIPSDQEAFFVPELPRRRVPLPRGGVPLQQQQGRGGVRGAGYRGRGQRGGGGRGGRGA